MLISIPDTSLSMGRDLSLMEKVGMLKPHQFRNQNMS